MNKLTLKQFIEFAPRTCALISNVHNISLDKAFEHKLNLIHFKLGVVTEIDEFLNASDRKNISEEIGDICWYLANWWVEVYKDFKDFNILRLETQIGAFEEDKKNLTFTELVTILNEAKVEIIDDCKKILAYDREPSVADFAIFELFGIVITFANKHGFEIEEIWFKNIQKLAIRYKDKFTKEEAIFRNTDKENEVL